MSRRAEAVPWLVDPMFAVLHVGCCIALYRRSRSSRRGGSREYTLCWDVQALLPGLPVHQWWLETKPCSRNPCSSPLRTFGRAEIQESGAMQC